MSEKNDPDLVDGNCYFSSAQRSDVFDKLTNCYEMRVVAPDRILEVYYKASIPDDGDFRLQGLRPPAPKITPRRPSTKPGKRELGDSYKWGSDTGDRETDGSSAASN